MKRLLSLRKDPPAILTILLMSAATLCSFLFFFCVPSGSANIALFYVFALVIIARDTKGYRFGVIAALFCVVFINYFFTYPHFKLNFTLSGYPVTFLVMLAIALIISTLTSHMKRQAEALAEAEKEKMRANLLRAVSHDLRTPLTSISGAVSVLLSSPEVSPKNLAMLSDIKQDADSLIVMVENLLSVTRVQDGTMPLKKREEMLEEVAGDALLTTRRRFPDCCIELDLSEDILYLPMDPLLIRQVMVNLLENAIRHTPPDSGMDVQLKVDDKENMAVFTVRDEGCGLDPGDLPHLFEPFYTGEKNRMDRGNTSNMRRSINAEANLQDVESLITTMRRNKEPLVHCAVFIELCAKDAEGLRALRDEVNATLTRSKIGTDRLFLLQRGGFLAANPAGSNIFASQFERVLPASSVANLFPFNYSGKNDPNGFYIGKDRFGSNIILDLDRRAEDKTNANVLILGNSGQGKSFLLKLLLCNILASGKSVICLDAEHELDDLCQHMGGCFADVMSGEYIINPLEPKLWNAESESDPDAPAAFRQRTRLSQHISFLKDFFRSYKDFTDRHIDTIELML